MISLQTNVAAINAQQNVGINQIFQQKTIAQLTSGYRINSSADDAAGLAVANRFRSDVNELQQGIRNANDGISNLQIIDGGLNNISQVLDRLKTLAAESASGTFSGDRSTLNNEFQGLLQEINRQAGNIGLVSGGKNNQLIKVYTGGGSSQTNAQVAIDLAGAANQVDATGLGLSGANLLAGGTGLTSNTIRLDAPGGTFVSSTAQTFTFNLYNAGSARAVTASVGGSGALTQAQVINSLNGQLSQYGISASVGSDGTLQFGGGTAFTVTTSTGGNSTDQIATDATTADNAGVYAAAGAASYTGVAENLTFQNGSGTATVALAATDTVDSAIAKINAQTASLGLYAVANSAGTGISLQSSSIFTASSDTASGTFTASGAQTVTAPTSTETTTGNALAALTSVESAVASLGLVQGRVGSGENRLQYAVQLAQSQISNFSSAESQIRDADVALQAANLTKAQVLQQASFAALAQANTAPQAVLKLLQ